MAVFQDDGEQYPGRRGHHLATNGRLLSGMVSAISNLDDTTSQDEMAVHGEDRDIYGDHFGYDHLDMYAWIRKRRDLESDCDCAAFDALWHAVMLSLIVGV